MKLQLQFLSILYIFLLSAFPVCNKEKECKSTEYRLDASRNWLPLKGKTQLTFFDESNNVANFRLWVQDTVENNIDPDCGTTHIYESINAILHLSTTDYPLIAFRLNPPNSFIVDAYTNNDPSFMVRDVFKSATEGTVAKSLKNYIVGTITYGEVILLFQSPKTSNPIDSIFIANNAGVVGFKYSGKKYTLQ